MANAVVTVLEADGTTQTDLTVLDVGRQAAVASKSTAMSTEDKAVLDAMAASLVTIDGRVDGLETLITSTNTKLDTAITALQIIDNMVLAAGTANIGDVDVLTINGVAPAFNSGNAGATVLRTTLATDDAAIATIVTAIQAVGSDVTPQPTTSGGLLIFRSLDLDESEEEVKATAGQLYKLRITNFAATAHYVKLYNATAASVTVGTTTPIDTIPVPAGSATAPTVITENFGGLGVPFSTALCLAATTGLADNDTGAPAANAVVVTAYYK